MDAAERRSYLNITRRATEKLARLVGQLFELSKLDARRVERQCETFNLSEFAHDVVQKFEPRAEQRGIGLRMHPEMRALMVDGDIAMIERAIENILDNTLRYTQRDGQVEVAVELVTPQPGFLSRTTVPASLPTNQRTFSIGSTGSTKAGRAIRTVPGWASPSRAKLSRRTAEQSHWRVTWTKARRSRFHFRFCTKRSLRQ